MFNTELSYHNFRKNGIPFSKFISKNGKENTAPKGTVFSFWWRRGESLRRNCCGYTPTDFATVHRKVAICLTANRPFRFPPFLNSRKENTAQKYGVLFLVEAGGIATPQLLWLPAHGLCDRSLKGRNLPCGKPSFSIPPTNRKTTPHQKARCCFLWRRGESNPRPKTDSRRHLRAQIFD